MGQRTNTAYVYWSRRAELAAALEDVFAAEGYRRIERPPEANAESDAGTPLMSPFWAIAILPGKDGWSVVKTVPVNLLCGVSAASGVPRLGELAAILHCPAFQYNVQDGSGEMLLEADPSGETRRSQAPWEPSPSTPSAKTGGQDGQARVQFQLLRLPALQAILTNQTDPPLRARTLAEILAGPVPVPPGEPAGTTGKKLEAPWKNEVQSQYLIPHRPLPIPSWIDLYFAEANTNRPEGG